MQGQEFMAFTSQMNLSGISQFSSDKLLDFVFTAMQLDLEFAIGSEEFVVVFVEHQVTLSQDFLFPLVQKTAGARVNQLDY
jgi:hypothetical protein